MLLFPTVQGNKIEFDRPGPATVADRLLCICLLNGVSYVLRTGYASEFGHGWSVVGPEKQGLRGTAMCDSGLSDGLVVM